MLNQLTHHLQRRWQISVSISQIPPLTQLQCLRATSYELRARLGTLYSCRKATASPLAAYCSDGVADRHLPHDTNPFLTLLESAPDPSSRKSLRLTPR